MYTFNRNFTQHIKPFIKKSGIGRKFWTKMTLVSAQYNVKFVLKFVVTLNLSTTCRNSRFFYCKK